MAPARSRLRALLLNTLLVFASLAALPLLVEAGLRLAAPLLKPRFTRIDTLLGWYHALSVSAWQTKEGHRYRLSYNGHGYRVPEHDYRKPAGVRRVVFLGDSFVDGSEVGDDEVFTRLLQQRLPGVEVINLGVYGYSTAQELLTLEHVALRYDPDLVVLATLTNDYSDNLFNFSNYGPAPRFVLEDGALVFEGTEHPEAQRNFRATSLPLPGMNFLNRHSRTYYLVNHYLYQRLKSRSIEARVAAQRRSQGPEEATALYLRLVARMQERCRREGRAFGVALFYPRETVQKGGADPPHGEAIAGLGALGVPTIDLFHDLVEAERSAPASLYYRGDFHWNAAGHAVAAGLLAERLGPWLSPEEAR